jgi:DNA repair exonuclease SbcCD nuclease subunit
MIVAHLSDLHLGRRSPGDALGAERLNALRRATTTLARHSPAVILIAGDVFDSPQVEKAVVQEAARILDRTGGMDAEPIPFVVIPGNHDPSDAVPLWTTFQASLAPNSVVRLARMPEAIQLCDGRLIVEAYPCETRYSPEPPWSRRLNISEAPADAVRVLLAHGTLVGGPVPEGESDAYPFTLAEAEALGAEYVALGHFHGTYPPWPGGDEIERTVCYSGTHEPDQFGGDSGNALLATLTQGRPTRLRRLPVGRRRWRLVEIASGADLHQVDALRAEVESHEDPSWFVIRFKLAARTRLSAEEAQKLEEIEGRLRALGAFVDRHGEVQTLINIENLDITSLPSGAVKQALLDLQEELAHGPADEKHREVLATALALGWEALREAR